MRYFMRLVFLFASIGSASALSPLPDQSAALFAGEWAGSGEHGSYCYVKLEQDGRGLVLADGGTGDWLGARVQWRNQRQALRVDKIMPLAASTRQRLIPLERFTFSSGFNQSPGLSWSAQFVACQLQRVEAAARQLARARAAIDALATEQGDR